jgi:hypothetical protein
MRRISHQGCPPIAIIPGTGYPIVRGVKANLCALWNP